MEYTLNINEDTKHGQASRAAMQTYARWIEREDVEKCRAILEEVAEARRTILGEYSRHYHEKE